MLALKIEKLTKNYGEVRALGGVDLTVNEGELFGLLGVNGAGKTTLIKVLCGLTEPDGGKAYIFGKDVSSEMGEIKKLVDVSPQETSVAPKLTVAENLNFFAEIYWSEKGERENVVSEVVRAFSLGEVLSRRAKTLSGGWQRRLSIAVALISRPKVLFLDEPTLGLDVLARRELWKIIGGLRGKVTIVLTSHYLEEIEALCDRVAILNKGEVLACGTTGEIKERAKADSFEDAFVNIVTEEVR